MNTKGANVKSLHRLAFYKAQCISSSISAETEVGPHFHCHFPPTSCVPCTSGDQCVKSCEGAGYWMTGKGPAHLPSAPNLQGEKKGVGVGGGSINSSHHSEYKSYMPGFLHMATVSWGDIYWRQLTSRRKNFLLPDKRSTWPRKNTLAIKYKKGEFVAPFWKVFTGLKKTLSTFVFWGGKNSSQ